VRERARTRCPVAYLTGEKAFAGLRLAVRRGVFIPRPETEGLVELVVGWFRRAGASAPAGPIVDACCGSGAVGIALAFALRRPVIATDVSSEAIALTHENASRCGAEGLVAARAGSLLGPVSEEPAAVVSNPPYVRSALIPGLDRDIRDFEPTAALDGGADGLDVVRALVGQAAPRLPPGAPLALEIGEEQGEAVRGLLAGGGWKGVRIEADLAGKARYALAKAPLRSPGGAGRVQS
ncbi:MAG: HemK/PrmC family methyltransferase, partial [bacterium]